MGRNIPRRVVTLRIEKGGGETQILKRAIYRKNCTWNNKCQRSIARGYSFTETCFFFFFFFDWMHTNYFHNTTQFLIYLCIGGLFTMLSFDPYETHLNTHPDWHCLTIIGCNFVLNDLLHQTLISYNVPWFIFSFMHIWWHHDDVIRF